jgi:signal peptidase I
VAGKEVWSWIKSLGVAVILALLIREHVLAFYVVDGSSMQPTLENGQLVVVNKLAYKLAEPRHGDVVVFASAGAEFGFEEKRVFIKRIIALPGDFLEIQEGTVLLNGEPLTEAYIDAEMQENFGPLFIEEGLFFAMGDNREPWGSWDSREFGPVPLETILGRAEFIIFPIPGNIK